MIRINKEDLGYADIGNGMTYGASNLAETSPSVYLAAPS